jgi:bacteriorhodopsin
MFWHSQSKLRALGRPHRKELFVAVALTPLLLLQIVTWTTRVVRGLQGEPLVISVLFGHDITASGPSWQLFGGMALYGVVIAIALLLLRACARQLQRWLFWRKRN